MFQNEGYSLSDIAAATGNRNDNYGWGADGGWFIWIILIFAIFGGWGNGFGFGGNGSRSGCATQADVREAVDQQTLISKLDQQTYGLATSTYDLNNTLMNGFHGVDNAVCTLGYQTQQGFNNLSHQLSDCCCTTQRAIDGVNYNIATQTNAIQNSMCNNTRDIIDNQNANTRSILDFLVQDKISTLQSENQNLKLAASQAKQNQFLVNELRPCPVPAYITCNPYTSSYGIGLNNGCGCC
jgi:hypothetical protein